MKLEDRVRELLGSKVDQHRDSDFFARYHEDFESSGIEKARVVLQDLEYKQQRLNIARCAYFSIGGSTGSEIYYILSNSEIKYGLIVEYDPSASKLAQDRADELRKQSKELVVVTGDATQQLERCKGQLLEWRDSQKIEGLIVSAQAVLHELPFRSPDFDLSHFIGEIVWDWDPLVFYSREPCRPSGWPEKVEIRVAGLSSNLLEPLAKDIRNSLRMSGTVKRAGTEFVSMPADLAVETIMKIFYLERYRHEIEEQLTVIRPDDIRAVFEKYLGPNSTTLVLLNTNGFVERYKEYGISARDFKGESLPMPMAFSLIVAERITETRGRLISGVKKPKADTFVKESFDIRPIQSQGENIFLIDKKGEIGGLDEFFVMVHFNLWTRYALEIINIELSYDLPVAMPGRQKISIDQPENVYEETDSSHRMKKRKKLDENVVSNIFVSRRFICNYAVADHADYRTVTIDFEVASPGWKGIKVLTVKGKLEPGGRWDIREISLHDGI